MMEDSDCMLLTDDDTSAELQTQFLDFCERLVNKGVLLIITSRFQYILLNIRAMMYHHRLKPLSSDESSDLLKSVVVNVDFIDDTDEKIAVLCAGISLALEIAATELQDNSYTPKELVELLENDRLEALNAENYSQEEQVRHVIKSSVDKLRYILRKMYIKLSYILSSFNADAIAYILDLHDGRSALAKRDVLIPLTTRLLVARDTLYGRFDFLLEYLSDELSSLPMEQLLSLRNRYCVFYGRLLQALAAVVEEDSCKKLPLFTIEIVNIQKLLYEAALCPTEDYDLFLDIACKAEYLIINFLPRRESVKFYAACVWAAESRKKTKHLGLMLSSYGQALNFTKSDWKVAQEQYERALTYLAPFGDSVDLAWLLNHIGWNLHMQGIRRKALKYFTDAEKTLMRMSEADKKGETRWERILAAVWSCIGISYVVLDEPERGIQYHEKALKMRRKWGDHPTIGGTYNNISLAYIRMGDVVKALSQTGLDIKMRFNQGPANDIIVSLNSVAINICLYKNDPVKAHKLLTKSLKMRESLGLQHVDTALIANNRGRVYGYEGNYGEAMKCYEKAVRIRENLQGQHESTARALYNMASLKMKLNELNDAFKFFSKCYEMRKNVFTRNHRGTELGEVMESLGKIHERRNEIREAEKYFWESLDEFGRLKKLFEEQGDVRQIKEMDACIALIRENLTNIKKLSTILDIEGARNDRDENDDDGQDDNDVNRLNGPSSSTRQNKCDNGENLDGSESETQIVEDGPAQNVARVESVDDVEGNDHHDNQSGDADTISTDTLLEDSLALRSLTIVVINSESLGELPNNHQEGPQSIVDQNTLSTDYGHADLDQCPRSPESGYGDELKWQKSTDPGFPTDIFQSTMEKEERTNGKDDAEEITNPDSKEPRVDNIINEEIKSFLIMALRKGSLKEINLKVKFDGEVEESPDKSSECKSTEHTLILTINKDGKLVHKSEVLSIDKINQTYENPVTFVKINEDCGTQTCPTLPEKTQTSRGVGLQATPGLDDRHDVQENGTNHADENVRKIVLNCKPNSDALRTKYRCTVPITNGKGKETVEASIGNCRHASVGNCRHALTENLRQKKLRQSPTRRRSRTPRGRIMYREEFERMKKKSIQKLHEMAHSNYQVDLGLNVDDMKLNGGKHDNMNKLSFNEHLKTWNQIEKHNISPKDMTENTAFDSPPKECLSQTCGFKSMLADGSASHDHFSNNVVSLDEFKAFPRNRPAYFLDDDLFLSDKQQRGSQIVVDMILDHYLPNEPNKSLNLKVTDDDKND